MDLEKIIEVSHKIADPYVKSAEAWRFTAKLLALLLTLSVCGNIYLATRGVDITLEQKNEYSDENNNVSIN